MGLDPNQIKPKDIASYTRNIIPNAVAINRREEESEEGMSVSIGEWSQEPIVFYMY